MNHGLSRNTVFLPFSVMLASNICIPTELRLSIQNGHSSYGANNRETNTEDDFDSEPEDLCFTDTINAILYDVNGGKPTFTFLYLFANWIDLFFLSLFYLNLRLNSNRIFAQRYSQMGKSFQLDIPPPLSQKGNGTRTRTEGVFE